MFNEEETEISHDSTNLLLQKKKRKNNLMLLWKVWSTPPPPHMVADAWREGVKEGLH